jgi:uncharacterized C2H2 Zn-finger protein
MKRHFTQKHSEATELAHLDSLLTLCERSKPENEPTDCPLCNERQSTFKQYQRHVGRHQEDLALIALPHLPGEEDETNDEFDSESEEQEELGSEVQEGLEKASSYVTRLSNESGDEATGAVNRSPRYSRSGSLATIEPTDKEMEYIGRREYPKYESIGVPLSAMRNTPYHLQGRPASENPEKLSTYTPSFQCEFCGCWTKRMSSLLHHQEWVHGTTLTRPQKKDMELPSKSNTSIQRPKKPLGKNSAVGDFDRGRVTENTDESYHYENPTSRVVDPVNVSGNFDPALADVLYLNHKNSSYTFNFPQHAIRDESSQRQ